MGEHDRRARVPRKELPADELILAALTRAAHHRARDTSAVPVWAIFDHLAARPRSAVVRHVRSRLDVMLAAGWLERSRIHGVLNWELTSAGRRRLQRARRGGMLGELPESPQHRSWRNAQALAAQEIDRFRRELSECLQEAASLLDEDIPARSDRWFELAELLQRACWRLGSASYCLREWSEPDDARADIESHLEPGEERLSPTERARRRYRRVGRRNTRLWLERPKR
jgi:hypothetical protein